MEVIEPYEATSDVGVATALDASGTRYFQSFLAAEPESPILMEALNEMLAYYNIPFEERPDIKVGPTTLLQAVNAIPESKRGKTVILEEIDLDSNNRLYPNVGRRDGVGCCCNFAVHDPARARVFFRSRTVGASTVCMPPGYIDPYETEVAEQLHSELQVTGIGENMQRAMRAEHE